MYCADLGGLSTEHFISSTANFGVDTAADQDNAELASPCRRQSRRRRRLERRAFLFLFLARRRRERASDQSLSEIKAS